MDRHPWRNASGHRWDGPFVADIIDLEDEACEDAIAARAEILRFLRLEGVRRRGLGSHTFGIVSDVLIKRDAILFR